MNYLKLNLSGVLQYFADTDSTTLRTTYNSSLYPTKRAIVGLISSAFGYGRGDKRITDLYNTIDIKYHVVSEPVIMEDFQTIKSLKSQQYYMNKFYKRNKFNTVSNAVQDRQLIKNVQYLQDAEYEIYVGGNDKLLQSIYNAMQNPVYSLYIGKRSCVPNKPIVTDFTLFSKEELTDVYDCA